MAVGPSLRCQLANGATGCARCIYGSFPLSIRFSFGLHLMLCVRALVCQTTLPRLLSSSLLLAALFATGRMYTCTRVLLPSTSLFHSLPLSFAEFCARGLCACVCGEVRSELCGACVLIRLCWAR